MSITTSKRALAKRASNSFVFERSPVMSSTSGESVLALWARLYIVTLAPRVSKCFTMPRLMRPVPPMINTFILAAQDTRRSTRWHERFITDHDHHRGRDTRAGRLGRPPRAGFLFDPRATARSPVARRGRRRATFRPQKGEGNGAGRYARRTEVEGDPGGSTDCCRRWRPLQDRWRRELDPVRAPPGSHGHRSPGSRCQRARRSVW